MIVADDRIITKLSGTYALSPNSSSTWDVRLFDSNGLLADSQTQHGTSVVVTVVAGGATVARRLTDDDALPPVPATTSGDQTTFSASTDACPNPERGFRLGLYELPRTDVPMAHAGVPALELTRRLNISMVVACKLLPQTSVCVSMPSDAPLPADAYMSEPEFDYSKPLPAAYLANLSRAFGEMRKAHVKCTLTFAFMRNDTSPEPPSYEVVFGYMDQLKELVRANVDVIYALKAGFIGAYGEWHGGKLIKNSTGLALLVAKELYDLLPPDRQVLIRTSREKLQWLLAINDDELPPGAPRRFPDGWRRGITDSRTALSQAAFARLGYHNDGFMALPGDGGTYVENDDSTCPMDTCKGAGGASDMNFAYFSYAAAESAYVIGDREMYYGTPNAKNGRPRVDGHDAAYRLRQHHVSTLSHVNSYSPFDGEHWDPPSEGGLSINIWQRTPLNLTRLRLWAMPVSPEYAAAATSRNLTIYDYNRDHLGYRLVLREATFPRTVKRSANLTLSLSLVNYGFAPLRNERPVLVALIAATVTAGSRDRAEGERIVHTWALDPQGDRGVGGDAGDPRTWQPHLPGDPSFQLLTHRITTTVRLGEAATLAPGPHKLGVFMPDSRASAARPGVPGARSRQLSSSDLEHPDFAVRFANADMEWWSEGAGDSAIGGVNVLGTMTLM